MKKIVENHELPIRLDRYLRSFNKSLSQSLIEKSIRKGLIKIDDKKAKSSNIRISNGNIVIFPDSFYAINEDIPSKREVDLAKKLVKKMIIFENQDFYAFNKPAGLATQGGSNISISMDDAFKALDLRIVHRLDKDTSGIILAAKNRDAAIKLTKAFEDKIIKKIYLACVSSKPKKAKGVIKNYMSKKDHYVMQSHKKHMEGAKEAETNYELLESQHNIALIKFMPITGRMHQLRLHAMDLGCPILGDKKYNGIDQKFLMLHANQIILDESIFGEEIIINSNPPDYFPIKQ